MRSAPSAAALLLASPLLLGACGSGGSRAADAAASPAGNAAHGHAVAVIYAGSLVALVEGDLGPGFRRTSGYSLEGFGGGSGEDVQQIKSRVRRLDVFVSAAASADAELQGTAGGDWVSWWATFATTPLVLGYNPASRFGRELARGRRWYEALGRPGIRVGRTDPALDPKGALTVAAVEEAARLLGRPALKAALGSFEVFPETALAGRLQSGQLDAGFFYAVEARAAGIRTVPLTPARRSAAYTVTVLNGAPDRAGAQAFVRYLLAHGTSAMLARHGLVPVAPAKLGGSPAAVPDGLRDALHTATP